MRQSLILFLFSTLTMNYSCKTSANLQDSIVNTPIYYTENKVLFVEARNNNSIYRELKFGYELNRDTILDILKLEPIGCILRGVRIPLTKELKDPRDIAVVLEVQTSGSEPLTSLVIFYQRNVKGGQMLNFQDLLVYYEPEWDGFTPPFFRLKLIDVKSERNEATEDLLNRASKVTDIINGIIPHPIIPGVQTAIEASKLILANKKNQTLLDYQINLYSSAQIEGANTNLLPLRRGEWVVIGREKDSTSHFWNHSFKINEKTGELLGTSNIEIKSPYISLSLMSADAAIPKHIMDRSSELVKKLGSNSSRNDINELENSAENIKSSVAAYRLERRLKKYSTTPDFKEIVEFLLDTTNNLNVEQSRRMYRLLNMYTGEEIYDPEILRKWWKEAPTLAQNGKLIKSNDLIKFVNGYEWKISNQ